jgi:hypothetical protein
MKHFVVIDTETKWVVGGLDLVSVEAPSWHRAGEAGLYKGRSL